MIKTLTIMNFQSHEATEVEFHPGLNVFVGTSDVGKSVLLRALGWIAYNRPRGADFRSSWAGRRPTVAEVELDDGTTVARVRTGTKNLYLLDGEELKAFRSDVPEEVREAMRLEDVNFQGQHDAPFMLSDSPAALARELNAVAHLEDIDAISTTANLIKIHNGMANVACEDELKRIEDDLAEMGDLDKFESEMKLVHQLHSEINEITQAGGALASVGSNLEKVVRELQGLPENSDLVVDEQTAAEIAAVAASGQKLDEQVSTLDSTVREMDRVRRTLAGSPPLPDSAEVDLLQKNVEESSQLRSTIDQLSSMITELTRIGSELSANEVNIANLIADRDEISPDKCPTCGTPWKRT